MIAMNAEQPTIRIETIYCDDFVDHEHFGDVQGTAFKFTDEHSGEVYFPLPESEAEPEIHFAGLDLSLEEAFKLVPQLLSVLNSPQIQHAWAIWQEQRDAQA